MNRRVFFLPVLLLAGCIAIPYEVAPEIVETGRVVFPSEAILLTRGPRQFLELMEQAVLEFDSRIVIIDGMGFRDTAFPDGGWTLQEMQGSPALMRVRQQLQVDYLLLFGPLAEEFSGWPVIPYPIPIGAGKSESQTTLSALVIDLNNGQPVSQLDVTAAGGGAGATFFFSVFSFAETRDSTVNGMARALIREIREHSSKPQPKIALLAAESDRLWKPIGAHGWTRVPLLEGAPVFHVFGECGFEDVQITLQQALDRANDLDLAGDRNASYACFDFIRDAAGDESEPGIEANRRMGLLLGEGGVREEVQREAEANAAWQPSR